MAGGLLVRGLSGKLPHLAWMTLACRSYPCYSPRPEQGHLGCLLSEQTGVKNPWAGSSAAGGEKRRLGIACALIGKPSLLFLDEPTTGLDSFAALTIMNHLSGLAASGHTVIASVHQPRAAVWDMFHKVRDLEDLISGPPRIVFRQLMSWTSRASQRLAWCSLHHGCRRAQGRTATCI